MKINLNEKTKKILIRTGALVLIVVAVVWFVQTDLEHIENTNGADNYNLQTITDMNIINRDIGAMGLKKSNSIVTNTISYSSKKFTGVEEIYGEISLLIVWNLILTTHMSQKVTLKLYYLLTMK